MDENIRDFLYSTASVFVFVMAITLFFTIQKTTTGMINALNQAYSSERTLYESNNPSSKSYVTGAQIIYSIRNGLESDIEIDHVFIDKTVESSSFNYAMVDIKGSYEGKSVINTKGQVTKIVYNKR